MYKKLFILLLCFVLTGCGPKKNEQILMIDLSNKTKEEIEEYAKENDLNLQWEYQYSEEIPKDGFISQNINPDTTIHAKELLEIVLSLGSKSALYQEKNVNEVGRIPVMMYHGIENKLDSETPYTGGNIDVDGYQRTAESFRRDLEFYYEKGYRMIALKDYIQGEIDVPLGFSPIVLTFDDGLANQIRVTGVDENGNLKIDPNCAVGILEDFKQKYPDYQVTATFFVNGGLFQQPDYNKEIVTWLIEHGYDIGNHSYSHANFKNLSYSEAQKEIGRVYNLLDELIPEKYVFIVALPYGSPGKKTHATFPGILNSVYNGKSYETLSTLQVGWESDYSPFSKQFDPQFIKRIRAYDNNGTDFDITYSFNRLEQNRYISDGDKNTVVVAKENQQYLKENLEKTLITY